MSQFRFEPPSTAELAALAKSDVVQDQMVDVAERGQAHAESIAPVDTGDYRSRFRVEQVGDEVHLINDDPGAAAIEFGSDDTQPHHVLVQTADWLEKGGDG